MLQLSTSGFYDWAHRPLTDRDLADGYLVNEIIDIHRASRGTYGSPRLHAELRLGKGIWWVAKRGQLARDRPE